MQGPYLSDETPGGHAIHARNRDPTIQCLREVAVLLSQFIEPSVQQLDLSFDKTQLAK